MIIKSFYSALNDVKNNLRMVVLFYVVNLFFGFLLLLPFRIPMSKMIGHSLLGEKLAGRFDMTMLFEFLTHSREALGSIRIFLIIGPILYMLVAILLSGGALSIFLEKRRYAALVFWQKSVQYFGRFLRLGLYMIPVFAVLICVQFVVNGIERLFWGADPYQYISYWGSWIKVLLRYIGFYIGVLILEYARIDAIVRDEKRMRRSLINAIRFVFKNFWKTAGFMVLIVVIGILILVIYNLLADLLSAPNAFIILLLFLLQQLYMFIRMGVLLITYSGLVNLYEMIPAKVESTSSASDQ